MASAVALLVASAALAGQPLPDFSGRWILESPAQPTEHFAREMSVTLRQPRGRLNERGEPIEPDSTSVTVVRDFDDGPRSETHQIGAMHGIVPGVRQHGSSDSTRRVEVVTWRGPVLEFIRHTFTGTEPETGVWEERREAWSLGSDDGLRVTITRRNSSEPTRTVVALYRRTAKPPGSDEPQ